MTTFHDRDDLQHRLDQLRLRTFLLASVALGLVLGGLLGMQEVMLSLFAQLFGLPADLPPLHIPAALVEGGASQSLAMVFWFCLVGMLIALSAGALRPLQALLVLAAVAGTGGVAVALTPYSASPLLVLPSQLERDISRGDFAGAVLWLQEQQKVIDKRYDSHYVRAQISLREGAGTGLLEADGAYLLQNVEGVLFGVDPVSGAAAAEPSRSLGNNSVGDYRAEIIYEVDRRVNGEPMTIIGMEYARLKARGLPPGWVGGALHGAVLLLGLFLFRAWWGMRRRIVVIDSYLESGQVRVLAVEALEESASAGA